MAPRQGDTRKGSKRRWSSWPCTSCSVQVEIGAYYTRWQAGEISKDEFDKTRTHCPNCGNPKSEAAEGEAYQDPAQTVLITDRATYDRTDRGANVACDYCTGESTVIDVDGAALRSCINCGAGMDGRDYADGPLPASSPKAEPVSRQERPRPQAPLFNDPGPEPSYGDPFAKVLWFLGLALSVAFVIWLCVYLFGKHETTAQVSSIGWEITHVVTQRKVNTDSDWKSDMPSGSYAQSCTNKFRETEACSHETCNPHQVVGPDVECNCGYVGTGTWSDNGDGSQTEIEVYTCGTCPGPSVTEYDLCHPGGDDVYEDWCDYKYDTWPEHARKTSDGEDHHPVPPSLVAVGNDQRLDAKQTLTVNWKDPEGLNGPWVDHPRSVLDYSRYDKGDYWIVEYNRSGSIWPKQRIGDSTSR